VVVEGYTDVIALVEAGLPNVVATLGTALTREHMKLLGRFAKRVVYLFDGDEAGLRAADRAAEFIGFDLTPEAGRERVELEVAVIPGNRDPADLTAEEGGAAVTALVSDAVPLLRFAIDRKLATHDLSRPEARASALRDAAQVLAAVRGSLLAHDYTNYVADRLMVDFGTVQKAVLEARTLPREAAEDESDIGRPTAVRPPLTPEMRAEAQLIGVLAAFPRLRPEACFLLSDDLLTDPVHRRILEHLIEHPSASVPELVASLEPTNPDAASLLTGVTVGVEDVDDPLGMANDLFRKLKEFGLDRLILGKKNELKSLDSAEHVQRYDDLFQEISTLQRTRDRLRSGLDDELNTEA